MRRSSILSTLGKPQSTFHFPWKVANKDAFTAVNIIEDEWLRQNGEENEVTDILYVDDKVIQVQESNENANLNNGVYPGDSLGDVVSKYKQLKLRSYGFEGREADGSYAGGSIGYFYDDERRGVAFFFGMQDTLENTLATKIDSIIIHRIGVAVIPPSGGDTVARTKPDRELTLPFLYSHIR